MRRTKIVASIGPASWDEPVLRKTIAAGADVIRINLSHGEPAAQLALIDRVRGVSTEENRTVGVLVDLPGPKLRMAPFPDGGVDLVPGDIVELRCGTPASDRHVIGVDLDDLGLAAGDRIMGGDGAVVLEVVDDVDGARSARAAARRGGRLQGRPATHLPDAAGAVAGPPDRAPARPVVAAAATPAALSPIPASNTPNRFRPITKKRKLRNATSAESVYTGTSNRKFTKFERHQPLLIYEA